MKKHKTHVVSKRRKREGKTNYRKRLRILLSNKNRLVVRVSDKDISAQIIERGVSGDKVKIAISGAKLKEYGWQYNSRNIPGAYLVGLVIAKKAKENKITEAVLDIGLRKSVPGSRLYAVLKGAIDNGLKIPFSESILPTEDRISGKHIEDYAKKLKENQQEYNKIFSSYIKNNLDPLSITKSFNDVKNKITGA